MKTKWLIVSGVLVLAVIVANHVEYYLRARSFSGQNPQSAPLIQLAPNTLGHTTIQINEQSLDAREFLHFDTLGTWAFEKNAPTPCPATIAEANGRQVKLVGFMYPLQDAASLKVFCLLRTTQTCCYGPRPQYNQYVFVEMSQPVKFDRLAPVVVEGRFFVDPRPDEGYIYRMEGTNIRPAMQSDQPVSAGEFARRNGLDVFDLAMLEGVKSAPDREAEFASKLLPLDGRTVVMQGFVIRRPKSDAGQLMIGRYFWDGLKGTAPNIFNAVPVHLSSPGESPPVWWQEAVYKGTLRVTQDPAARARYGVVSLHDATLAIVRGQPSAQALSGPMLPVVYEMALLAVFAAAAFMLRKPRKNRPSPSGESS